ncbi:hypothetical protein GCM10008986_20230 [Salinibacillus aidingensis]|uniref:Uncharacterized protein n=1 Tax=Salinibacillus aidingensis TaxID=237684 RepID=A0ABN1BCH4_9BACI
MGILLYITMTIVFLSILYLIIETAVKNGIERSALGQYLQEKTKEEKAENADHHS